MMELTRQVTASRTEEDALWVGRRILGDLLAIHEKFGIATEGYMRGLASDISLGLVADCLDSLTLFLYEPYGIDPVAAYKYTRSAPSTFAASPHSGRIQRDSRLIGGRMEAEVTFRNKTTWNSLAHQFSLTWTHCVGQSIAGMIATANGGYAAGNVGMSRTYYSRNR